MFQKACCLFWNSSCLHFVASYYPHLLPPITCQIVLHNFLLQPQDNIYCTEKKRWTTGVLGIHFLAIYCKYQMASLKCFVSNVKYQIAILACQVSDSKYYYDLNIKFCQPNKYLCLFSPFGINPIFTLLLFYLVWLGSVFIKGEQGSDIGTSKVKQLFCSNAGWIIIANLETRLPRNICPHTKYLVVIRLLTI